MPFDVNTSKEYQMLKNFMDRKYKFFKYLWVRNQKDGQERISQLRREKGMVCIS
jgi:hypothetical protein